MKIIDRKYAAHIGLYEGLISEQYHPYISPQEMGHKTDIRWVKLKGTKSAELHFYGNPSFEMNVLHFSVEQLTREGWGSLNSIDLKAEDVVHLCIDHKHMGCRRGRFWGSHPLEKYKIRPEHYEFSFFIDVK